MTHTWKAMLVLVSTTLLMSGCASLRLSPVSENDLVNTSAADRRAAQEGVEPITAPLSLEEAIARALKYNLDRRARMMEEAIALKQWDLSKLDMLPQWLASAGYTHRSEDLVTRSIDSVTGEPSLANPFISSDREHALYDLGLTWNLLDFGVSYYNAKQNGDRVLIAAERRRKAMHTLIQDVRIAFWRAASAQKLSGEVRSVVALAESALNDARTAEMERLRSPLESLRYQRQLLENLRLLEAIDQELSTARVELAQLVNAPLGISLVVVEPNEMLSKQILDTPIERMEEIAIKQNADLREQFYNSRIAHDEARKTIVKMFPTLRLNYDVKYDTDSYLVHDHWNETGVQLSYNLFGLLSAPYQRRLTNAGIALADQRRVAMQMAVIAQVHLARLQFANAWQQYVRADAIWNVDDQINRHVANRERAQAVSKLEQVANNTTTILSLLRRYQSLAQAHAAASRLQATLGMELNVGRVQTTPLAELTATVARGLEAWQQGALPSPDAPNAK